MTDYKDAIRRAIAKLPENNSVARRTVYEKARSVLVDQLRRAVPQLSVREITANRLSLEDDIRVVEFEASEAITKKLTREPDPAKAKPKPSEKRAVNGTPRSKVTSGERVKTRRSRKVVEEPEHPADKDQSTTYVVKPTAFFIPKGRQESDFVSIMMPFSSDFNAVYRSINLVVGKIGWKVARADSIWEDQVIIQDIFGLIFKSRVVICDFSNKNPNVLYEAGVAHTLGRDVIPIAQDLIDLPFDLRHHRALIYENTKSGRAKFRKELENRLRYLQDN